MLVSSWSRRAAGGEKGNTLPRTGRQTLSTGSGKCPRLLESITRWDEPLVVLVMHPPSQGVTSTNDSREHSGKKKCHVEADARTIATGLHVRCLARHGSIVLVRWWRKKGIFFRAPVDGRLRGWVSVHRSASGEVERIREWESRWLCWPCTR